MKVNKIHSPNNFQSKNNPIKPFVINTKVGRLFVSETPIEEFKDRKFLRKILRFFIENFASSTKDPYWLRFKDTSNRGRMIDFYEDYMRPTINKDDGNMSLLVARDKTGKLCGACWSHSYRQIPEAQETTCYIEALAVDKKYRGCRLGERLLNVTLNANKKTFTDVFLRGEMYAVGFYKRMGFDVMSESIPAQQPVMKILAEMGEGYPDYIKFFTKALQPSKPRWFDAISSR